MNIPTKDALWIKDVLIEITITKDYFDKLIEYEDPYDVEKLLFGKISDIEFKKLVNSLFEFESDKK